MIKYVGRSYNGLKMKRIVANSISWLVIVAFALTDILWQAPIELSHGDVLVKQSHLRPKSAWNSKGAQDIESGLESQPVLKSHSAGSAKQETVNSAKQKAEIALLVKELNAKGIKPKVNGRKLSEFITRSPRLLEHIQDYSIIKEPEDIKLILMDMLDVKRGRSPPEEAKVKQLLYKAIFDQDKLPADKPLKVVLLRGGKGGGDFTELIKRIPNIEITIVLGASDDGRSWFIAARDFNMTGIPDCGKSLLDLAEDDKVAALLGARMKGDKEELYTDFENLIKRLEGDKRVKISKKAQKLYSLARKIEEDKRARLLKYLKKFQKTYPIKSDRFTFDNIPIRSVVLVGAAWYFEARRVKDYCQKAVDEVGKLLDIGRNRVCFATSERQHLMALMKDARIYFSETGINEDPKHSDFIGLWLMDKKFDIDDKNDQLMMALKKEGIELEGVTIGSNRKRNNGRDINGRKIPSGIQDEIRDTSRRIKDCTNNKLQKVAEIISGLSRTAGKDRIGASPDAKGAIEDADAIIYCPTTLESNIGNALVIRDVQDAIRRNQKATKLHFVNMTIENDPPQTKAGDMLERLFRYTSNQQGYTRPSLDWSSVGEYVNYVVGKGTEYPNLDKTKTYIKVDKDNISKATKGKVRTVTLDLENKEPAMEEAKDYKKRVKHWGFNSPLLMKETMAALGWINRLGYYINEETRLRSRYEDVSKGQDIRGDAQEELSDDVVENLARAYAVLLRQKTKKASPTVVVGRDVRWHSLRIQKVIIKTLRDMAVNVIDIGKPGPEGSDFNCPTPLLYFAVKHYNADSGINVTASHLEINQNGLKLVFRSGDEIRNISEEELKKLGYIAMLGEFKSPAKKGQVKIGRPLKTYIENTVSLIRQALKDQPGIDKERPLSGKKIVVEAGGGTVGFMVQILESLGAEAIGLHLEPDPELKVLVNPDHEETMEELKARVLEERADLGMAFDSDGDRVGFITDKGKRVDGNELLTFLSINVLKDHPGSYIVYNNKVSTVVEETIRKNGGIPVAWKTGYAFIREKIKKLQDEGKIVGFGGEDSAHVMFPENDNFDDGTYTAAKFLIYLIKDAEKRPISRIIDEFPRRITFLNLKMPILKLDERGQILRDEDGQPVIEDDIGTLNSIKMGVAKEIGGYFRGQGLPVEDFGLQNPADGARVEFKAQEGWALLRGSLYDPFIEVCLDADTFSNIYYMIDEILERMSRYPQVDMTKLRNLRKRLETEEKAHQPRKDTNAFRKKIQGIKSSSAGIVGEDEFSAFLSFYKGKEPSLSIYRDHAANVTDIAMILAKNLGFSEDETKAIVKASLLHDVGNNYEDRKLRDEITAFARRHSISSTFVGLRKQLRDEGIAITPELENRLDKVLEDRLRKAGLKITPEIKRHLRIIIYHERCSIEIIRQANIELSALEELLIRYHNYPSELTPENFDRLFPGRFNREEKDDLMRKARRLLSVITAADTIEASSSHIRSMHIPDYHRRAGTLEDLFGSLDRKCRRGDINPETYALANKLILTQDADLLGVIKKARQLSIDKPLPDFDLETIAYRRALLDLVEQGVKVGEDGLLRDGQGQLLDKGKIDFLVDSFVQRRGVMDGPGLTLFRDINRVALHRGYENLPAQSRCGFIRLLAVGDARLIDEATSLTETARRELRTLFTNRDEITFANISEDILYGLIEEKEGFIGFADTEPFPGMPRMLFIGPAHFPMGKSDVTIRARRLFPHSYRTASFLEQHGIAADIYDVNLDGWEGLKKVIDERQYDFICCSPSNPVGEADLEMAGYISRVCPDTVLVLGGEGAAFDYDRFLERHKIPAVVIRGFGSKIMLDMAVNYKKRHQTEQMRSYLYNLFRRIPNLYLQDADGRAIPTRLVKQFTQKYLRVVSRLVNYAKIPYGRYWDADLEKRASVDFLMTEEERLFYRDTVRIVTKSHCPHNCAFCSYCHFLTSSISERAQPVLSLPANDIYVMVRKILDAHPRFRKNGIIFFHDDDLISPETEKMLKLFEAGYGLNEDVVYFGFTRIDRVDDTLLSKKYKAGFRKLLYGIETFSDRLLKIMNKIYKTTSSVQLAKKVIRSTLKAGIIPVMTLILFYPYANFEDVKIAIDETVELTAEGAIPNVYPYAEARAGADLTKEARAKKMEIVGKHIMPVDPELRRLAEQSLLKQEEVENQIRDKYDWRHDFTPAIEAMIFFKAVYQTKGISTKRIDEVIDILVNRYRDELIGNFFEWMKNPEGEKVYSFGEVVSELKRVVSDYRKRINAYLLNHPGLKDEIFRTKERIASLAGGEVGEKTDLWDVYIPLAVEIIQAKQNCSNNRIAVAVAGPTGVGKGVFADALAVVLQCIVGGWEKIGLIDMDRFYYSEDRFEELGISGGDRWAPEALNTQLLIETISNFRNGAQITQPVVVYEKMKGKRDRRTREYRITTNEKEAVAADEILLVDGGYLLNNDTSSYKRLYEQFDRRLFLDVPAELIGEWRIARGLRFGTLSPEGFKAHWENYQVYRIENQRQSIVNADTVFVKGPDHRIKRVLKGPLKPPAKARRTKTPIEKGINNIQAIVERFEEPQVLISLKKKRKGDTFSARVKRYLEPYLRDLLNTDWDNLIKAHPRSPEGEAEYLRIKNAIAGIEKVVNTFGSLRERRVFYATSEPKRRITLRTELKDILDSSDFSQDEEQIVAEAKRQCRDLLERIEDETKPILRTIKLLVGRYDVDIRYRAENGIKKPGRKLGILPSSFNPLHKGHIDIAKKAIKELGIDEVVLVMTEHKETLGSTPQDRMDMLKEFARSDSKGVYSVASSETEVLMEIVFDIEQLYPHDTKIFFIMGATSAYASLDGFYKKETHLRELLAASNLAICNTSVPGRDLEHLKELPAYQKAQPQVYILNEGKPISPISSTKIREAIKQGNDITDFAPGEILKIIQERGLYLENDVSFDNDSPFNIKFSSAGEDRGISVIKVVDALCGRVERRFGVKIDKDMRRELIAEFDSQPLPRLVEEGFESFEKAAREKDREGLKRLVWLEAGLLYYNGLPLLSHQGRYAPVDVGIDHQAMEKMIMARIEFSQGLNKELAAQTKRYWEFELPQYRGEVYSFNQARDKRPEVSVDIAVMSARYLALLRRIEELKHFSRQRDLELVVCIADPENFSQDKWISLKEAISRCGFPVKVVFSKKNTIATNRNLVSSVSSGKYRVFLDDDVQMVGPVIENLVGVLEEYPEVGVVSTPSYEPSLCTFRPRWHNLKYPLNKDVFITNTILGMVMATREEIVQVLPFVKFWPNNGEDRIFCRQVHKMGFLSAFAMPEDGYLVHETEKDWKGLRDCILCESLMYYLETENYDDMTDSLSVRWLKKYGKSDMPIEIVDRFWEDFKKKISSYFSGQEDAFEDMLKGSYDNEWFRENIEEVQGAIDYLHENAVTISAFKIGEYTEKDLSGINPFLGPLKYKIYRYRSSNLSSFLTTEAIISAPLAFTDPEELADAEFIQRALKLQEAGIDTLHFDIKTQACIDNLPVYGQPNNDIFNPFLIKKLREAGFERPIEVHLMDYSTEGSYIEELHNAGASALFIYHDSFTERENVIRALKFIKGLGMESGVVLRIREGTDELSDDILRYSDVIVLTAAGEGRKGMSFNPIVVEKSKQLLLERDYQGRILIQSGINDKTISVAASGGAVEFVIGSYIKKCGERGEDWKEVIESLRANATESRVKFLKAVAQTEGADTAKSPLDRIDLQRKIEIAISEAA